MTMVLFIKRDKESVIRDIVSTADANSQITKQQSQNMSIIELLWGALRHEMQCKIDVTKLMYA